MYNAYQNLALMFLMISSSANKQLLHGEVLNSKIYNMAQQIKWY